MDDRKCANCIHLEVCAICKPWPFDCGCDQYLELVRKPITEKGQTMRAIDADKLPVQKIYHVDEAGYGATFYMVDVEDIKAAPTITYADLVPHGRWVGKYSSLGQCVYYRCSECGESEPRQGTTRAQAPYCANCGAKMDGGKDNERA